MKVTSPDGHSVTVTAGGRVTFGRAGTDVLVDFPLTYSMFCSRLAGTITAEDDAVRVTSRQRPASGGVTVHTAHGQFLAAVGSGEEYRCARPHLLVRLVVEDTPHDLRVDQATVGTGDPRPIDGDGTVTEPSAAWQLVALLDPAVGSEWRTAIAIGRALTEHGRPGSGTEAGAVPEVAQISRWYKKVTGESRSPAYFTALWKRAATAFGVPVVQKQPMHVQVTAAAAAAGLPAQDVVRALWDTLG